MKILGIDTATEIASVGIIGDTEKEITRHCHRTLSRDLISMVEEVLSGSGTTLKDLAGFAVSIGPGSFTGLRIGLATAKGMSLSRGIPVIPVRTLDALASQVTGRDHPVAVVQRARKGEVYFGMYGNKDSEQEKLVAVKVVALKNISQEIDDPVTLVGNAVDQVTPLLEAKKVIPLAKPVQPSGLAVARLGISLLPETPLDKTDRLEPYYIKEPDAKPKTIKHE